MLKFEDEVKNIMEEIITVRRYIHQNAEVGFELNNTLQFVKDKLLEYGYNSYELGKCGLICDINNNKNKTILLRADMDALPIKEEANISFKSDRNMHACGHDIHTSILLGFAKIIKKYINELDFNIRLMFQPAEEILSGANDMIENGVLNNISEAYMLHVIIPSPFETGTIIISDSKRTAPSCDYININILGKSVHGAMPSLGIDPIIIASNIIKELKNISDDYTLTFGMINGGNTYNVVPSEVEIKGTLRTFDENVRSIIKDKIKNRSKEIANEFGGDVNVEFPTSAPVLINDLKLVEKISNLLTLNNLKVIKTSELEAKSKIIGSEDFAYVSQKVSSVMIGISAGKIEDGYNYPLHNENVIFDENVIFYGVLIYLYIALKKAQ